MNMKKSGIPIVNSNRKRSFSSSRPSTSSNVVARSRGSSLDRRASKSSCLNEKNVLCTPINSKYFSSTPNTGRCSSTSKHFPPSVLKERNSILKLSSQQNHVNQQFSKVQEFLSSSGYFDQNLINANNIKPFTIKSFIYVMDTILNLLFDDVSITQANYKEEIPKKLKVLKYGTIANSVLKTVNTSHSWPQIICMIGWLIDKVELPRNSLINPSMLPEDEQRHFLLQQTIFDFKTQSFRLFMDREPQEMQINCKQHYLEIFKDILKFDVEEYQSLKNKCNELKKKIPEIINENENLKKQNEAIRMEIEEQQKSLNKDSKLAEIELIKKELETQIALCKKLEDEEHELLIKTKKLQEEVEKQPYSNEDIELLKNQKKYLKEEISVLEHNFEKLQNSNPGYNSTLYELTMELKSKITNWNEPLQLICIQRPELICLSLTETGFEEDKFYEELNDVVELANNVKLELNKNIQTTELKLKNISYKISSDRGKLEELKSKVQGFELKSQQITKSIAILDTKIKQAANDWKDEKIIIEKKIEDGLNEGDEKELEEKIFIKTKTKEKLILKLKKFSEECLQFFISLNELTENFAEELTLVLNEKKQEYEESIIKQLELKERALNLLFKNLPNPDNV